ncbi:TonB-dependent receptor [bacterium AH-315-K03]|nr:TonB-dependent receptor [bacterium AH-315-K03]
MNRLYAALLSAGLIQSATTVSAQSLVLEEIIVTSQIRAESLQDVPVSVSAVSGSKLTDAGIDKIEDLQAYVPNLSMSETGIGTNIYIRGIGSGINQGFEQSVGMYVDGISYGRAQLSRAPFLDLARVEVLRGPQNILFGKNSIAGALSIITAKPTDEFEGSVSALYEPEYGEQVFDVMLSGPLSRDVTARLAYRNRTLDGYVENLTLNRDEPNRDEETLRLTVQWDASEKLDFTLKLENSTFDVLGRQVEIVNESPSASPLAPFPGATYGQILAGIPGVDPSVSNNTADFRRSSNGDSSENETSNITLTANYGLGESNLTFITGFVEYDYDETCDCDFTGANFLSLRTQEDYEQFSQEIRFASALGGTFEFLGGVFYQTSELDFNDASTIDANSILPGIVNGLVPGLNLGDSTAQTITPRVFTTDTDIYSAFLQTTWNVNDSLRLTVGGRYTYEEKDGSRALTITDLDGNPQLDTDTLLAFITAFKVVPHSLSGDRTEEKLSPSINLQYDLNNDVMLYATLSQGNKSGGYDARSNANTTPTPSPLTGTNIAGTFEFQDEEANSIELGAKTTLLDGAAEFNIAAFYTEYKNLQVSIFDGTLGFNVGNAGEAETMGVEMDGRFRVSENLTLIGSLAFLDFEFTNFPNGQCNLGETPTSSFNGAQVCDYKGRTNQYVADFSGTITADYTKDITSNLALRASIDVVFTDDYNPTQTLDPAMDQDGYSKINARVSIADVYDTWEFALVGKNLTDESVVSYANATPLAGSSFLVPSYYAFFEPQRTVALQAVFRF